MIIKYLEMKPNIHKKNILKKNNKKYTQKHITGERYEEYHKHNKKLTKKKLIQIIQYRYNEFFNSKLNDFFNKNKYIKVPLFGYLNRENLKQILKYGIIYMLLFDNVIIGIVFFKNLTYEKKYYILGSHYYKKFKSKSDIQIYQFYYFIDNKYQFSNELYNRLYRNFKYDNQNIKKDNIIITLYEFLNLKNKREYDVLSRHNIFLNNIVNKNKYAYIDFEYNGYHITMNDEIINTYSKRYFTNEITSEDFFPTYAITRQIKNENAINLNNLEDNLTENGLYNINSVFRYYIDNSFIYYAPSISLYNSIPYENKFVISFLSNRLGNTHILERYNFMYKMMAEYYGYNSKKLDKFAKIINNKKEAYKYFNTKEYELIFEKLILYKNIFNEIPENIKAPKTKHEFDLLFNKLENSNDYYWLKCYDNNNKVLLKDNTKYLISPYILFTYINNKYNAYVFDKSALYLFASKEKRMQYKGIYFFPENFNNFTNDFIDTNEIQKQIREAVKDIAKMFEKYKTLEINQINGFFVMNLYIQLFENVKNNYKYNILVTNSDYTIYFPNYYDNLHNYIVDDYIQWINELVIKPSFIPNYKTSFTELHYQPLDLTN